LYPFTKSHELTVLFLNNKQSSQAVFSADRPQCIIPAQAGIQNATSITNLPSAARHLGIDAPATRSFPSNQPIPYHPHSGQSKLTNTALTHKITPTGVHFP
jgi:hypothetical protein